MSSSFLLTAGGAHAGAARSAAPRTLAIAAAHARNCADMSESRGRRNRSLLSSYYGTEAPDADVAAAPPAADQDDSNIDGAAFDADKYVSALLQQRSLEELVQRGNAMVSEIKSLDSDMQMLVYENYNKFISATDTIRKMKHRVEVRDAARHAPN